MPSPFDPTRPCPPGSEIKLRSVRVGLSWLNVLADAHTLESATQELPRVVLPIGSITSCDDTTNDDRQCPFSDGRNTDSNETPAWKSLSSRLGVEATEAMAHETAVLKAAATAAAARRAAAQRALDNEARCVCT